MQGLTDYSHAAARTSQAVLLRADAHSEAETLAYDRVVKRCRREEQEALEKNFTPEVARAAELRRRLILRIEAAGEPPLVFKLEQQVQCEQQFN